MTISILLRLVPDELRRGNLVGRLRVVATGEERLFRDTDELAAAAADVLAESPAPVDGPAGDAQASAGSG